LYGLSRRGNQIDKNIHNNLRQRIREIIDGPGSCGGYRTIWHTLRMQGYQVPRAIV